MLRVSGGRLKGRVLRAPAGLATRPSAAKLRQALFNIIGPDIQGARVLDIFAGSGALGLEALSRGAARCLFVDQAPAAMKALKANIEALGLSGQARALIADAARPQAAIAAAAPFDLILADPPYGRGLAAAVMELVARQGLLAPQGLLAIEHAPGESPPPPPGWRLVSERSYGQSRLSFFSPASAPERQAT